MFSSCLLPISLLSREATQFYFFIHVFFYFISPIKQTRSAATRWWKDIFEQVIKFYYFLLSLLILMLPACFLPLLTFNMYIYFIYLILFYKCSFLMDENGINSLKDILMEVKNMPVSSMPIILIISHKTLSAKNYFLQPKWIGRAWQKIPTLSKEEVVIMRTVTYWP